MVCSNCRKSGHNRSTCTEVVLVEDTCSPTTEGEQVSITLPQEVREKFVLITDMCKEVAQGLGKGYPEAVYQHALCMELQARNIQYGYELPMTLSYKGKTIPHHTHRLDIMTYDWLPFIFELKATGTPIKCTEHWQLARYLLQQNVPYGAVVNFMQTYRGGVEIDFIVCIDGKLMLYNCETNTGIEMRDYRYTV